MNRQDGPFHSIDSCPVFRREHRAVKAAGVAEALTARCSRLIRHNRLNGAGRPPHFPFSNHSIHGCPALLDRVERCLRVRCRDQTPTPGGHRRCRCIMPHMRKAVVIGIDSYESAPLEYCVADAESMGTILEMPEYGYQVSTLFNAQATRRSVLAALNRLFAGDDDEVILYFAGHGAATDLGVFLVTSDGDDVEPGVSLDYLRNMLRRPAASNITAVVILDCCHAGSATVRGGPTQAFTPMSSENVIDSIQGLSGKVVFAACRSEEGAQESTRLRHGLFTAHIVDGLCGGATDTEGCVTVSTLYDYVAKPFESVVGQTPVFRGDLVGRVVLGSGLPPRTQQELAESELMTIEQQAEGVINDYVRMTAMDLRSWVTGGYLDACGRLTPILRWLNRYKDNVKLRLRPRFTNAVTTANSKLAHLGDLVEGLITPLGTVKQKLGTSTFGSVWRIVDPTGADLAYKVYHPTELENQEKLDRFGRGFRAMQQLNHSNIAKVHHYTDVPVGFSMDYIAGPNAREYVAGGVEIIDGLRHLQIVTQAVMHAHSHGVMHRDIKPENILMRWTESGTYDAVLADFDLAWFSTATQLTRQGFGTYIYGSPEQIEAPRSNAAHEPTTDVYSLGQVLFFLVCGHDPAPRLADNHHALAQKLANEVSAQPARLLLALYDNSIKTASDQRIQTASELAEILREAITRIEGESSTTPLEGRSFSRELVFSFVGLDPRRRLSEMSFVTEASATIVEVVHAELYTGRMVIDVRIHCQVFGLAGIDSKTARRTVNQRLDDLIDRERRMTRKTGRQGPFETFIQVRDLLPTLAGVADARRVIADVLSILERRE